MSRTMKMSEGVEWAIHSCLNLAWANREAIPASRLAAYHELPPAYLNKQLQALCRAGILTSTTGPRGGFRLARPLHDISFMDVVTAIEGGDDAFACTEIRQRGPNGGPAENFPHTCAVSRMMRAAELTWRRELAQHTLADAKHQAEHDAPGLAERVRDWFGPS